jgi:hypothetical protein
MIFRQIPEEWNAMGKLVRLIVVGGMAWVCGETAQAQYVRSSDAARPQRQYFAADSSPTVSPYVNLGTNSNGISNYQTLVRPMIEERATLERQSAALEQLNQRMRGAKGRDGLGPEGRASQPRSVRFMDYSRYFGTTW